MQKAGLFLLIQLKVQINFLNNISIVVRFSLCLAYLMSYSGISCKWQFSF